MKKKWFRTTELVSEEYLAEADPAQSKAKHLPKRVWISAVAACACLALVLGSFWLFKPKDTNPPRIDNYTLGCDDSNEPEVVVPPNTKDYSEVIKLLAPLKTENKYDGTMRPGDFDGVVDDGAPPTVAPGDAPNSAVPDGGMNSGTGAESEGYVEVTDNQTAGVIEADRIKRTNTHIFYLDGGKLRVFSIAGEDSKEVGSYTLVEDITAYHAVSLDEFFLSADGKTVTVMAVYSDKNWKPTVRITSLDVSDPTNITEKNRLEISGNYLSSRVTDGKILLMTKYGVNRYNMDFADERTFLPQINGQSIPACDIILPEEATNASYTVVLQLDENTLEIQGQAACLSYSQEAYVSQNHIFLSRNFTKAEEQENKKTSNSMTEITCLSYGDTFEKKGTITLRGYLKDKWSMDEYEGILRVVTTTQTITMVETTYGGAVTIRREDDQTNASLYCVDLQNFQLVAKVEDFAPPGEDVKSVRFDKDTAYVCTAVQLTDPVFFFDLSDLNNITYKHTGNIDGFSSSLVNFGDGYLLGIGNEDWSTFKVEIYREGENGVESFCAFTLPNSWYAQDYKAYYIDRENGLLGLGVTYSDTKSHYGYMVLHFDGDNLNQVLFEELRGPLDNLRGVYIDGFMYVFGAEDFKVAKIF